MARLRGLHTRSRRGCKRELPIFSSRLEICFRAGFCGHARAQFSQIQQQTGDLRLHVTGQAMDTRTDAQQPRTGGKIGFWGEIGQVDDRGFWRVVCGVFRLGFGRGGRNLCDLLRLSRQRALEELGQAGLRCRFRCRFLFGLSFGRGELRRIGRVAVRGASGSGVARG